MTIRKMSLVGLVILVLTLPMAVLGGYADFKPGSEPDGFRGIKWGTDISTLRDMELIEKDGVKALYERKGDDLKIGSAKLKKIQYIFSDGKLSGIGIKTQGENNYNRLKESVFDKFGKGKEPKSDDRMGAQDFRWRGKLTNMILVYDGLSENTTLFFFSIEFSEK
jgi:hypothetical protein